MSTLVWLWSVSPPVECARDCHPWSVKSTDVSGKERRQLSTSLSFSRLLLFLPTPLINIQTFRFACVPGRATHCYTRRWTYWQSYTSRSVLPVLPPSVSCFSDGVICKVSGRITPVLLKWQWLDIKIFWFLMLFFYYSIVWHCYLFISNIIQKWPLTFGSDAILYLNICINVLNKFKYKIASLPNKKHPYRKYSEIKNNIHIYEWMNQWGIYSI